MINILRHNVSENIDMYESPYNLRFLAFLAAEVGHRGGEAIALKAQLDVAGVVVLTSSGSRLADHAKGAQAVAVRHGELHLAEGTERRRDGLTHILQHGLTRSTEVTEHGAGANARSRPGGGGNIVSHTVRVQSNPVNPVEQVAHVDVVAYVASVHLGSTIEDRGHLYIPELEKNSQSTCRFPSVFISCGREDG